MYLTTRRIVQFWGQAFIVLARAARDLAHHPTLMPCAEALLWLTGNGFPLFGENLAEHAASACVSLLSQNEDGLTLDKQAVDKVLTIVHRFFDESPTANWTTKMAVREKDGAKVAAKVQLIVDMVIADASKYSACVHVVLFRSQVARGVCVFHLPS